MLSPEPAPPYCGLPFHSQSVLPLEEGEKGGGRGKREGGGRRRKKMGEAKRKEEGKRSEGGQG